MHKRTIWAIIILMSLGLLGTAIIQVYWFRSGITLQEQRFDTDVFDALNSIQQRLIMEEEQNLNAFDLIRTLNAPGASLQSQSGWVKKELAEFLSESQQIREEALAHLQSLNDTLLTEEEFANLIASQDEWRKTRMQIEVMDSRARMRDLESRLQPEALQNLITQELSNQGIHIKSHFGVYSNRGRSFVILNGMYVVEVGDSDFSTVEVKCDQETLLNSEYQIALFNRGPGPSPGTLRLYFPDKGTWLWSSLLPTLFGTIIFTGLILFCFAYTIWIILRQKKISAMKTDFINNMTHEFKTPIATISLATDSILSPKVISSKDKIQRFADIIKQENKRMLGQVEKVLQMALIDKSEFDLMLTEVDMHNIINKAIENANLQVQRRGGSISKELNASKFVIQGDQTHLSNVIHNLLDNANKYSPDAPDISVRTYNVSGGVEVIVEDHGVGLTSDSRKQIFDKFYRVHTGNVHDIKGFGLGLSYVKAITDAHSGKIDVRSKPGEGSSFILYLPYNGPKNNAA
jgi:two-component system, OmpR family, phosphate regulon sensor histidine kinase PhoR